ncbi:MAG: SDR family oxidoreductase [Hyphomicrobiaceae bacterium]|nr:SDR family oxidoreductase [Hyphomicrobiaceae bacterium]
MTSTSHDARDETSRGLFKGERALVTGAASNIGRAIAIALAREGADVIVTDIDADRVTETAQAIAAVGGGAETIVADLSTPDGWKHVLAAADANRLDIFVHSACPKRQEADIVAAVSEETFDAMLNTNVRSGFLLARGVAAGMQEHGKDGRILFLTSLHAETPRNLPHYSASKAGLTMLMKEMARQLGPAGIRVNAIAPGAIPGGGFATDEESFQPRRKIPLGRFGTAEDIADASLALLSNRFMRYVTGATLVVDGGLQLYSWIEPPDV